MLAAPEPTSRSRAQVWRSVAVPTALLLMFLIPADSRPQQVEVNNFFYDPNEVTILAGDTVTWFNQFGTHSATSNAPLVLWDSGLMSRGDTYSFQFKASGMYLYHCTLHFNMTGLVSVAPTASPQNGQVGTVFTITVASEDAAARFVYDVQKKPPGEKFQGWITVTTASVEFDSADDVPGRYQFRARLRDTSNNVSSLWSPPVVIRVNPPG